MFCDRVCFSLAARILWRMDKEGSVVSDMQLTTLDELEDHICDITGDDLKDFKVDIHNFLDFWPRSSKPHTVDSVSHILGVVRELLIIISGVQKCTNAWNNYDFLMLLKEVSYVHQD